VKERKVPRAARAVPKAARAPRMVAWVETKARATPRAVVKTIWAPRIKARAIIKEMKYKPKLLLFSFL
jgi:hypothetical protein